MAQTYAELQEQIAKLQTEAQQLRQQELATVIAKIRGDIQAYQITPQDLFGKLAPKGSTSKPKAAGSAKFADGNGNVWTGRGPRPKWLRDALASGKELSDFAPGAPSAKAEPVVAAKSAKPAANKAGATKAMPKKTTPTKAPSKKSRVPAAK